MLVVPNIKDTNFWKQFTTKEPTLEELPTLFRISKILTSESNSQQQIKAPNFSIGCSEYQRY